MTIEEDIKNLLEESLSQKMRERMMQDEKNRSRARSHYELHHKDIHKLLDSIKQGLDKKRPKDENIHWGHVGDLSDLHQQLRHIHDRIHGIGEYSNQIR